MARRRARRLRRRRRASAATSSTASRMRRRCAHRCSVPARRRRSRWPAPMPKASRQPTFFDLYGFFPGNFVGNPRSSRKARAGSKRRCAYARALSTRRSPPIASASSDEIVDVYDPRPSSRRPINRAATSRRSGVEAEGGWQPATGCGCRRNYAFLHATQPDACRVASRPSCAGPGTADRLRRRHGGAVELWRLARLCRRASRSPRQLPLRRGPPDSYWLADARVAYAVTPGVEMFARGVEPVRCQIIRIRPATAPKARGLFAGIRLGGSAIIAVKLASAASLPSTLARPANLHTLRALLDEFDVELEQAAGLDRRAELGALDGHEIDQLAGVRRGRGFRPQARPRPGPAPRRSARPA